MTTSLLRAEGLVKRYRLPHGLLCAPAPLVGRTRTREREAKVAKRTARQRGARR